MYVVQRRTDLDRPVKISDYCNSELDTVIKRSKT